MVAPVIANNQGARRAGQDRAAPKGSLDAPKALPNNRVPERRERLRYSPRNTARVNSIGLAPSNGKIGVCARNRISSSGDSGSVRRASIDWAMNAKSFKRAEQAAIPGPAERELRHPHRSSAMSVAATPTMANTLAHGVRKHRANRFDSANRKYDRKSGPFADEEQMLTPTDLEDVAIPVAEPRGGLDGGQVVGLFQAREQLLCAT